MDASEVERRRKKQNAAIVRKTLQEKGERIRKRGRKARTGLSPTTIMSMKGDILPRQSGQPLARYLKDGKRVKISIAPKGIISL